MSGRRIDDHSFWAGKGKEYPLPMNTKMKPEMSAGGNEMSGSLSYPDTTEMIKRDQETGMKKSNSHSHKSGYRN